MSQTNLHTKITACGRVLEKSYPRQSQAQDGEIWVCTCGRKFAHLCDEAEGCSWIPVTR